MIIMIATAAALQSAATPPVHMVARVYGGNFTLPFASIEACQRARDQIIADQSNAETERRRNPAPGVVQTVAAPVPLISCVSSR